MELKYQNLDLPLKYQFEVAYSKKTIAKNVLIKFNHDGISGYGESAPSYFYNENAESVGKFVKNAMPYLGDDPYNVGYIMDQLNANFDGNYAAKAGINLALLDWIGKKKGVPVQALFDIQSKQDMVTSFTIGIDTIEVIKEKVLDAEDMPVLKIKLGTDQDYKIVETIRSLTGKPLRIDANEGWSREEAVEKINWLETQNVDIVEQPLPARDIENMKWIRERVNLPLFADESVKTGSDFEKLTGAFDGINVKLMKCGGITEAVKMVRIAKSMGFRTMLGCFIESSLAITAAAHISPLFDYVDLDGALLLQSDPFKGVMIEKGVISLPQRPGFGVEQSQGD